LLQLFSPTSATTNNQKKKLQNKQLNTHLLTTSVDLMQK
jgi:hypothetical protein